MKHVDIYTDGACRGNPGVGGWGAVLVYGKAEKEISGGDPKTTNNRMELTAAIAAMELLREPCEITLTSDSRYLTDAINKNWLASWKKRGYKKSDNSPVPNTDLFFWVRGHDGHPYNERCDALATAFADCMKK